MTEAAVNYTCPNCGGKLIFNAEKQNFICEWCASDFSEADLKNIAPVDDTAETAAASAEREAFENGSSLYVCDSCGAEIIADENTAASFCAYCHSPVTLKGRISGELCPERIIPFSKTKEDAIEGFRTWCGKKLLLPTGFLSQATCEKITGLYVPFWIADSKVKGRMAAKCEIIHSHTSGNTTRTNHKEFMVDREVNMEYIGVPADGSKKLDDRMMDALEPFDYTAAKVFSMSYLQGFYADRYDVSKDDVLPRIQLRIDEETKKALLASIVGYSTVLPISSDINFESIKWHYVMLPVWLMSYKYNGKYYYYAMNGQTGKFSGIMPLSLPKMFAWAAVIAVVFGAIGGFLFGLV